MAAELPKESPKPTNKQTLSVSLAAGFVFAINHFFDGKDDSNTRQLLAPIASFAGYYLGSVATAISDFIAKFWVIRTEHYFIRSALQKNIKEINRKIKSTTNRKQVQKLEEERDGYERLIRENRFKNLDTTIAEAKPADPTTPNNPAQ